METGVLPADRYGYDFIPPRYLPPGEDEYWIRNEQTGRRPWRALESHEIEILIRGQNRCSNWDNFLVTDPFDPALIKNSSFYGLVRIGVLRNVLLRRHDFSVPTGIRNSAVISCDIGDDTAIQDCAYISHYIIGDRVILSRIDEMQTTNHAKFGNGVIKDGEEEDVRVWIDVMNEAGGRSILPFRDMIPADAYLWAGFRDDKALVSRLKEITQEAYGSRRGAYGTIGPGAVIKSCRIIKDVEVGCHAYIKGANKLKNITILSSEEEPSQIGEGVEMVNGIVGYGGHAFYGAKAVRFVMGRNCNLKYGARLIHSVLGDNSTVSCCEILNNLIFPVHEQHHNNSFLIASLIQGLSNMAAGATIGSNHNSRANDGEIRAGRGFWPGLAVTLKHSSRFASFTLIAKGNYSYELDIPFPFSLVNNNIKENRLEVMPAYYWLYNLYALERNSWKSAARDRRRIKAQTVETGYLAPDTAEEIKAALDLLEKSMAKAGIPGARGENSPKPLGGEEEEDPEYDIGLENDEAIPAAGLERHRRGAVILKPARARTAYRQMLYYYAVKTLAEYLAERPELTLEKFFALLEAEEAYGEWINLGGQIMPVLRLDDLRRRIREGGVRTWEAIHAEYTLAAAAYPLDRARHAWETYKFLRGEAAQTLKTRESFGQELAWLIKKRRWICGEVYLSRAKDFNDPFRGVTYRNGEEMREVVGSAADNPFVILFREKSRVFEEAMEKLRGRILSG